MSKQGMNSNPHYQQTMREREKLKRRQYDSDLRSILATPEGRRFLWRIVEDTCGIYSQSFDSNSQVTAFNEGRRKVGLVLWEQAMRLSPADCVRTYQEQLKAKEEEALQRKAAELEAAREPDDA